MEKKLFEFQMSSSNYRCIVKNPVIKEGIVQATIVAKLNSPPIEKYTRCAPHNLVAGGNFILEEYKGSIE